MSKGVRVSVYCSFPQKLKVKGYQIYCFKKTVSFLWELRFYNWLNFIFNSDRFESNINKEINVKAILIVPFVTTETKKKKKKKNQLLKHASAAGGYEVVFWLNQPEVENNCT